MSEDFDFDSSVNWAALEAPGKQAALGGLDANPEAAAEAVKLAKQTGAPAIAIEQNPAPFKQQVQQRVIDDTLDGSLELQTWASKHQMAPRVAADDWSNLGAFNRTLKELGPIVKPVTEQQAFESFVAAGGDPAEYSAERETVKRENSQIAAQWMAGQLSAQRGALGAQRMVTDPLGMVDQTEERVKAIEESLKRTGEPKGLMEEISNMLGGLTESVGPAFAGAMVGTAVGTPGFGTGSGAMAGFAVDQGRIAAGNKYLDLRRAQLNPTAAWTASLLYGTTAGFLNYAGGKSIERPFAQLGQKMASEAIDKIAADRGGRMVMEAAAKELFRGSVTGGAIMGAQAIASEIADAITLTLSKDAQGGNFTTFLNDPYQRQASLDNIVNATLQGMKLIGIMHLPGVGANMIADGMYVRQAKVNADRMKAMMEARDRTMTFQRAPELIGEFVKEHSLGAFGLDPQTALTIHKDNPAAFSFIPDFERKATDALETGTKLEIAPADYLQHVTTELHSQLKDDLSINDGLTVNEANLLKDVPPRYDAAKPETFAPETLAELEHRGKTEGTETGIVGLDKDLAQAIERHGVPVEHTETGSSVTANDLAQFIENQRAQAEKKLSEEVSKDPFVRGVAEQALMSTVELGNAQARAAGLNALFADAKAAGMTKAEFALYNKRLAQAQQAIEDKAFQVAERQAKSRLTKTWKERTEVMRGEVEADLQNLPETNTLHYLAGRPEAPKLKLDRKVTERMLGDYAGNRADYPELPSTLYGKDGVHPDVLAGLLGYESGMELLSALGRLGQERLETGNNWAKIYDSRITEEANLRMEQKYGDLQEAIREAAMEAALNAKQIDVLSNELEAIMRLGGLETPLTKAALEETVREKFNRVTAGKNTPERWTAAAGRMGRAAELMLLRGKFDEAAMAKQRQMLAVRLAQEARTFQKETNKFERSIQPLLKNETVQRYEQGYVDQLQRLLNVAFGYDTKRQMDELNRGNPKPLRDFIDEKRAVGVQLDLPTFLDDPSFKPTKPEDLTVGQAWQLHDFVAEMLFQGREAKTLMVNGKAVELIKARSLAIESANKISAAWQVDKAGTGWAPNKFLSGVRLYDAANVRMERLLGWLDRRDPNGMWSQMITRPMQTGKHYVMEKSKELATYLRELPGVDRLGEKLPDSPFRNSLGDSLRADRETLIAAMLNVGNKSNLQVLTRGGHTTVGETMAWIQRHATKKDWDYVQAVWDMWERHIWPDQERVAREMTGVGLQKIEAQEIQTPFGTYRGGYYPLIEDFNSIDKQLRNERMLPNGMPLVPTATFMERRTGAAYPLDLTLDRLGGKIAETLHYIGYAKAWKDATTFLDDPAMLRAIDTAFGKEYRDQLQVWMNDVATAGGPGQRTGLEWMARALNFGRTNAVMMLIGFKPGTAVLHGGAAFFNSLREVGIMPFARAAVDLTFRNNENAQKWTDFAYQNSPELRNRKQSLDRDVGAAILRLQQEGKFHGARAAYINFSTALVATLDQYSATPTWLAAYSKAMREFDGKYADAHERATFAADQTVRNAHGANGLVDLPAIMRGKGPGREFLKFFTMFGGFYNHIYNQIRDTGYMGAEAYRAAFKEGNFNEAQAKAMGFVGGFLGYILAGSLWHSMVRGYAPGEDEEWNPGGYAAHSVQEQMMATLPFIRDIGYWMKQGMRGNVQLGSVLDTWATGVVSFPKDIYHMNAGSESQKKAAYKNWFKDFLEMPGWLLGIGPSRTLANWANYGKDLMQGNARAPTGIYEYRNLLLDARRPVDRRNKK